MTYRTFGDLREQVEAELDTEDESFVQESEMIRYFNSAVTLCEATMVKLGLREKYLQSESLISLVQGQTDYTLPSDIVASKIRKVVYRNGPLVYTMRPMTVEAGYAIEDVNKITTSCEYYYYMLYKIGTDIIFRITPGAVSSVANAVRLVYMKSLNRYVNETDLCDVPEICYEYIQSYVRYRVYAKESHQNTADEKANMVALNQLMQETLANQIADPQADEVEQDMSHYDDMN